MEGDASGTITYLNLENKTETYNFKIPKIVNFRGKCFDKAVNGSATEFIALEFYPNDITPSVAPEKPWTLSIIFKENPEQTNNAYIVDHYKLEVNYYSELFNTTEQTGVYAKNPDAEVEWHGEKTIGFTCSKSGLALTNDSNILFEHLKFVAFGLYESSNFTDTQGFEQCKLDIRTSDLVPIVVGACLAALVIIVLIAYLIGRQRARRQGYASV